MDCRKFIHVIIFLTINTVTMRTALICDNHILNINCSFGSILSIARANYGRFSIGVCNDEAKEDIDTDCETMKETTEILRNR